MNHNYSLPLHMRKIIPVFLAFLALLSACRPDTGAEEFKAPETMSANAQVKGHSVLLTASVPTLRVEDYGFLIAERNGVDFTDIAGQRKDSAGQLVFEATLNDLKPSTEYQWIAYAKAGEFRIATEPQYFTMPERPPYDTPVIFEDMQFKQSLLSDYDYDRDGEISIREAESITEIYISTDHIKSLAGIENMPNLTALTCRYSSDDGRGGLTRLDLSGNTLLSYLDCSFNRIEELDLSVLPHLEELHCNHNELVSLNITQNPLLHIVCINSNRLQSVDLTKNKVMTDLHLDHNRIEEVDLSMNLQLSVNDVDLGPMPDEKGNNLLKRVVLPASRTDLASVVPLGVEISYR